MAVVVTSVDAEEAFEVRLVDDQDVVEALAVHGAHEPFGERIRVRGSYLSTTRRAESC